MTDRFNRDIKLNIGGIPIESKVKTIPQNDTPQPMLKIEFSIKKDLNKDPNTAEIGKGRSEGRNEKNIKSGHFVGRVVIKRHEEKQKRRRIKTVGEMCGDMMKP